MPKAKSIVLYDNNFTEHKYFDQIVDELVESGLPCDIHGLHVDSFTRHHAKRFAELKWCAQGENGTPYLRFSFDKVKYADGYFGWKEHAPFDAIIITAAANHIPPPLIKQLNKGGRLILPLGSTLFYQTLTLVIKRKGDLDVQQMGAVSFVPMIGEVEEKK